MFAGDLAFNGGTPFVLMGSVAGSIEAAEKAADLGASTIIPGHGPVCGPEVFGDSIDYMRFVQDQATEAQEAGRSPLEQAQQADLGRFADWHDAERLVGNLYRAMSELRGEPRGIPLDMAAIVADMITFNGGQPLRCVA